MPNPYLDEYVQFIQQATTGWETGGGDPATITGFNSSSSMQATNLSLTHTITTPRGSDSQTKQHNIGAVLAIPTVATAAAAGGTGNVDVTVSPVGAPLLATPDQPWLTTVVAGTVVTWTAAENTATLSRLATIRLGTSAQSYTQIVTITQDAAIAGKK